MNRIIRKAICSEVADIMDVIEAAKVNTYKILNADVLVVTEKSLEVIDGILNK